jgi:biotin carboxyl carrier protein
MTKRRVVRLELDGGEAESLELERSETATVRIVASSPPRESSVEVLRGPPRPLVLVDGRVVSLVSLMASGVTHVHWRGSTHSVRSNGGPASARGARPSRPPATAATITAPMPGRVVQVHVSPGDTVETGAPLLVIEAMKMQNALFSPRSGRIASILVGEGQTIERGVALVKFEVTSDAGS